MLDTQVLVDPPVGERWPAPTPFACPWTKNGDDVAWVRVSGELDLATSPQLERTLQEAQRAARLVVADLRRVAFADSSAVHALLAADARARRGAGRLVILRGPPHVDRVFALSAVCEGLEIVDIDPGAPPVMALLHLADQERDAAPSSSPGRPRHRLAAWGRHRTR
jgi:anti-anti-sigma factor